MHDAVLVGVLQRLADGGTMASASSGVNARAYCLRRFAPSTNSISRIIERRRASAEIVTTVTIWG